MPYDCRAYRVLIASPSDVEAEREIAVRVIQEWNDLNSYTRKVALLPLRWETHTAPEYGTRPQEVINRAIVDNCDLLVGVFWTRIGTTTGLADSGTLEEIERVGKAGKPVMLYFSNVEIDPERIDLVQLQRLQSFKEKTYPNGLVEHFKTQIDFKDKLARQLEIKLRELQQGDESGVVPLSLDFVSADNGNVIHNNISYTIRKPIIIANGSEQEAAATTLSELIENTINANLTVPLAILITNPSQSGVRNIYINLTIRPSSNSARVTEKVGFGDKWLRTFNIYLSSASRLGLDTKIPLPRRFDVVQEKVQEFTTGNLQRTENGWSLSIEWEALQPQRSRLVGQTLYVYAEENTRLDIEAKIFSDSFSEPLTLKAETNIQVSEKHVNLEELIPDWETRAKEVSESKDKGPPFVQIVGKS